MRLVPQRRQWRNWSLPAKASYAGAVLAVVSLLLWVVDRATASRPADDAYAVHLNAIREANRSAFRLNGLNSEFQRILDPELNSAAIPRSLYLAEALSVKDLVSSTPAHPSFYEIQADLRRSVDAYAEDLGTLLSSLIPGRAKDTAAARSRLLQDYLDFVNAVTSLEELFASRYRSHFSELLVTTRSAAAQRRFRDAAFVYPLLVRMSASGSGRSEHSQVIYEYARLLLQLAADPKDIGLIESKPDPALFASRIIWLQSGAYSMALSTLSLAVNQFLAERNSSMAGETLGLLGNMHLGFPFRNPEAAVTYFERAHQQLQGSGSSLLPRVLNGLGSALILLAKGESSIAERTALCDHARTTFERGLSTMAELGIDDPRVKFILETNHESAMAGCQDLSIVDLFF